MPDQHNAVFGFHDVVFGFDPARDADTAVAMWISPEGQMTNLGWVTADGIVATHDRAYGEPLAGQLSALFDRAAALRGGVLSTAAVPLNNLDPGIIAMMTGDRTPEHAAPIDQKPTTPAEDILSAIDDVLQESTKAVCGCGCGKAIGPNSPSLDFATPDCQSYWSQLLATDPNDVYTRPDAAYDTYPAPPVPDRDVAAEVRFLDDAAVLTTPPPPAPIIDPGQPHTGLTVYRDIPVLYQTICVECGEWMTPQLALDPREPEPPSSSFADYLRHLGVADSAAPQRQRIIQTCSACQADMPGPIYRGDVQEHTHTNGILATLTDGQARVKQIVTDRELSGQFMPPEAMVRCMWVTLERKIERFRRQYLGRWAPRTDRRGDV